MRKLYWLGALLALAVTPEMRTQSAPGQPPRGTLIESAPATNAPVARAAARPPLAMPANAAPLQTKDGYLQASFDFLASFSPGVKYVPVKSNPPALIQDIAPTLTLPIPEKIRALDNKKVAVTGFLLPLDAQAGVTTEFLILRSQQTCCFGIPPTANEWVHVRMKGKGVKALMDIPLTICGTLHVGEYCETGKLLGVYKMDGDKMADLGSSR